MNAPNRVINKHAPTYGLNNANIDHRNFLEMLLLIAKFDPILKQYIDKIVSKSNTNRGRGSLVT